MKLVVGAVGAVAKASEMEKGKKHKEEGNEDINKWRMKKDRNRGGEEG
jgi:hypothetical protein